MNNTVDKRKKNDRGKYKRKCRVLAVLLAFFIFLAMNPWPTDGVRAEEEVWAEEMSGNTSEILQTEIFGDITGDIFEGDVSADDALSECSEENVSETVEEVPEEEEENPETDTGEIYEETENDAGIPEIMRSPMNEAWNESVEDEDWQAKLANMDAVVSVKTGNSRRFVYMEQGQRFDTGYDPAGPEYVLSADSTVAARVGGSDGKVRANALCIDEGYYDGHADAANGMPKDNTIIEVVKKDIRQALGSGYQTDEIVAEFTRLVYHAIHSDSYPITRVHYILCYYLSKHGRTGTGQNVSNATFSDYSTSELEGYIQECLGKGEIPQTVDFQLYYLESKVENIPLSERVYQSFLTWQESEHQEEPEDYYIAIRKIDGTGKLLNDIPFTLEVTGIRFGDENETTVKYETEDTGYLTTGWFFDTTGTTKSTMWPRAKSGSTALAAEPRYRDSSGNWQQVPDGIAIAYLGKFKERPTKVLVQEKMTEAQRTIYLAQTTGAYDMASHGFLYREIEAAIQNAAASDLTWKNYRRTYAALVKESSDPSCTDGNPNYALKGAEYKLFREKKDAQDALAARLLNTPDYSKSIGTFTVKADGTSNVLEVTSQMKKDQTTGIRNAEGTVFYVVESKAAKNYRISDQIGSVTVTEANDAGNPAVFRVEDEPVRGEIGAGIRKISNGNRAADLENASFTMSYYPLDVSKNYTARQIRKKMKTPAWSKTYTTAMLKLSEGDYLGALIEEEFPLGYLIIEETDPPTDYRMPGQGDIAAVNGVSGPFQMVFVLDSKGSAETGYEPDSAWMLDEAGNRTTQLKPILSGASGRKGTQQTKTVNELVFSNGIIRGDIELQKVSDREEEPLEGAIFEIENLDTHEVHRIVTDADGFASTAANYQKHDENTGYYDDGKNYDGTKAGIWFREDPEDLTARDQTPDNDDGAMIAGWYRVTEIDANGCQKEEPLEIRIGWELVEEDGCFVWKEPEQGTLDHATYRIFDPDREDGQARITDMRMTEIGTLALTVDPELAGIMDTNTKDARDTLIRDGLYSEAKVLEPAADQVVWDICSYTNLRVDTTYTMVGTLMLKQEDGTVTVFTRPDGSAVTASTEFTTAAGYQASRYEACGTVTVRFEGLDLTEYAGCEFVVYERLYLGTETEGDAIAVRYPGSNNDTVTFPLIHENPDSEDQSVSVKELPPEPEVPEDSVKPRPPKEEEPPTPPEEPEPQDTTIVRKPQPQDTTDVREPEPQDTVVKRQPQTGDGTPLTIFGILLGVGALGALILIHFRKKK